MATWLRASTAADVKVGPFVSSTDGNTVQSALTITQPDIRLAKNGGAWAQKSAAQTLSHEENGWYEVSLSTTDTDTLGILIVAIHESGALPVWREFNVVPANVYDSLFSTDLLQVDITQWLGTTPNILSAGRVPANIQAMAAGVLDAGAIATGAFTAAKFAADYLAAVNAEVDTALADYDAPTFAELDARTDAIEADTQDIQARLPTVLVSGRIDAAVSDAGVAADMDSYAAKVWIGRESTTSDHYVVIWFKNGQPVTSGITSPTIQVIKVSDGTDLIASTSLTEVGSLGIYKKDESTNKLTAGQMYVAKVVATIDGSSRTWFQPVNRDSA